jgi:hypothetical protein
VSKKKTERTILVEETKEKKPSRMLCSLVAIGHRRATMQSNFGLFPPVIFAQNGIAVSGTSRLTELRCRLDAEVNFSDRILM